MTTKITQQEKPFPEGVDPATREVYLSDADFQAEKPFAEGVDPATREVCLSDADFQAAFGISKEKYASTPPWKRELLKKKLKLF
ncbi:hypothetical protein T484DRAFT_1771908 [Baffinella frigidus]|nr:hypothetical protein T484DRAFT_1771908 [Cryptophyta sp. CCMP2293]